MRTYRLEENSLLNYTSVNEYLVNKSTIIFLDEVTVMLLLSNITISTENQNNSIQFITTRKQKLNVKQKQLVWLFSVVPWK